MKLRTEKDYYIESRRLREETMRMADALKTTPASAVLASPHRRRDSPEAGLVARGQRMEACASGQLLILAPWEHHNEHLAIRRDQCMALNDMARMICEN